MMGQTRIAFRNFTGLDLSSARRFTVPKYKQPAMGEQTLLQGAVAAAALVSNFGKVASATLPAAAPTHSLTTTGTVPGASIRPFRDFTTASGGVVVAAGIGQGIYYWNKPTGGEIGLYGSLSLGIMGNIGVGAGIAVAWLFGPAPSVLAGDCIALSVDVGVDVLTFSGQLFLSAPPVSLGMPPSITGAWTPQIIGIGYAITAGFSVLPVSISVMPTRTWTRPVTTF